MFLAAPGQDLEGGGVRQQQHVGFVDAGETLNRGAAAQAPSKALSTSAATRGATDLRRVPTTSVNQTSGG